MWNSQSGSQQRRAVNLNPAANLVCRVSSVCYLLWDLQKMNVCIIEIVCQTKKKKNKSQHHLHILLV